jgi:hypothetical protein
VGLKTVEAGLNWEVVECLVGETGREVAFDGDISPLVAFDVMGFGCNPVGGRVPFGSAAFPMGLEKSGRLGVAFVGEAGARRAAYCIVNILLGIMYPIRSYVRVFEARSSS